MMLLFEANLTITDGEDGDRRVTITEISFTEDPASGN